jgi:hypothetical protein
MKINPHKFSIVTQWYLPKQEHRLQEMQLALQLNCENPLIEKIIFLNEEIYELPIKDQKISQVVIGERLTFGDVYDYCIKHGNQHEAWCFANSDIAFDDTLSRVYFSTPEEVYCLTRYDVINGNWELFSENNIPRADSQDSWIFLTPKTPLKSDPFTGISPYQVEIGQLGFDNKIALILHVSGFYCKNSCKTIKTYHYHFQRDSPHDVAREKFRIPFPYLLLNATEIDEETKISLDIIVQMKMPATSFEKVNRIRLPILPTDRLENLQLQLKVDAKFMTVQ